VIVLSTSRAERDVAASYERGASCYVVKPIELDDFLATIGSIRSFWLGCAKLPSP
jgi:DNA-binding response OmpR family regulator